MHLAAIGSHVAASWNLHSHRATCQIRGRRKTVILVSKTSSPGPGTFGMTPNRNGWLLKGDVSVDLHPVSDETVDPRGEVGRETAVLSGNLCSHRKDVGGGDGTA